MVLPRRSPEPTPAEFDVLKVLWKAGRLSAREVHERRALRGGGKRNIAEDTRLGHEQGAKLRVIESRNACPPLLIELPSSTRSTQRQNRNSRRAESFQIAIGGAMRDLESRGELAHGELSMRLQEQKSREQPVRTHDRDPEPPIMTRDDIYRSLESAPEETNVMTTQDLGRKLVSYCKEGKNLEAIANVVRVTGKSESDARATLAKPTGTFVTMDEVAAKNVPQAEVSSVDQALPETDVLYVTRVQKERFEDPADYEKVKGAYVIDPEVMKAAKQEMAVLHPLPRVGEISVDFDDDPRAAYFRQMEYGLYVRMALLAMVLGKA